MGGCIRSEDRGSPRRGASGRHQPLPRPIREAPCDPSSASEGPSAPPHPAFDLGAGWYAPLRVSVKCKFDYFSTIFRLFRLFRHTQKVAREAIAFLVRGGKKLYKPKEDELLPNLPKPTAIWASVVRSRVVAAARSRPNASSRCRGPGRSRCTWGRARHSSTRAIARCAPMGLAKILLWVEIRTKPKATGGVIPTGSWRCARSSHQTRAESCVEKTGK